jgi:hypothetical protein
MAWYDDPQVFYRPDVDISEPISQGDIVIAPTCAILRGTAENNVAGPTDLDQSRRVSIWAASSDTYPAAPALAADVYWGLAIVVPHSCSMEKEWNERVQALMANGQEEEKAVVAATADESLDPFITLSPILGYECIPATVSPSVRDGTRIGSFPICANDVIPERYVDLNRISTVHHKVVPRARRVATLSDLSLAHLQNRLAMNFAFRALDKYDTLSRAIGHRIIDIAVTNRTKNKLVVNFVLDDGTTITTEGNPRPVQARATPVRPPRS